MYRLGASMLSWKGNEDEDFKKNKCSNIISRSDCRAYARTDFHAGTDADSHSHARPYAYARADSYAYPGAHADPGAEHKYHEESYR